MRRSLVFAILSTPVLAFAGLTLWAQFSASGSALGWTELSLPVRVGLALNNWTILDRLLHHGHILKCGPRSWRTRARADLRQQEVTR